MRMALSGRCWSTRSPGVPASALVLVVLVSIGLVALVSVGPHGVDVVGLAGHRHVMNERPSLSISPYQKTSGLSLDDGE